jgi:hypothetical protein
MAAPKRTLFDKIREYDDPVARHMGDIRRAAMVNYYDTKPSPSAKADITKSMVSRAKGSKLSKAMGSRGGQSYRSESSYSRISRGMRGGR